LIAEGVEPARSRYSFATNGEANDIAAALEARKDQRSIESDQNALHDPEIRRFLTYLRAAAYFGDDEMLAAALHLHSPRSMRSTCTRSMHYARRNDMLAADVLRDIESLRKRSSKKPDAAHEAYLTLEKIRQAREAAFRISSNRMITESGLLASILGGAHTIETLGKLGGLMRDIETLTSQHPIIRCVRSRIISALLDEHHIAVHKENRAAGAWVLCAS